MNQNRNVADRAGVIESLSHVWPNHRFADRFGIDGIVLWHLR